MALERHTIEKKDFPIGRRGYDPEAVDAHLSALADEIQTLKQSNRQRSETLASSASERVRAIVDAAETSAAEIQHVAEQEAQEIRAEATSESKATREEAVSQARDYIGKVSESTTAMLQRVDAMEAELAALVEALRTGGNRLNADLQLLEGNLTEVTEAVRPQQRFEPESEPTGAAENSEPQPQAVGGGGEIEAPHNEPAEPEPSAPSTGADMAGEGTGGSEDEGARLIALNMALNKTPREETDRYLKENYQLTDRAALLDEVYASIEG